ncbi:MULTISPECIES: HD domain-containing protein [Streptococcus]|uniref:HD domain-containing protein n=1 Tax=Streptococcus caledonicus TaxID=2614158 RepID=A0ABW0UB48_9STRE|nr:HD domain-containing protein [Streptococcus sp. S784/96/1]
MDKKLILENTRQFVKNLSDGEASGHDWWHIVRVTKTTLTIAKEDGADPFICEMAALLHDVADEKLNASEAEGLAKLTAFLDSQSLPSELKAEILAIIQGISYKGGHNQAVLSLEGQVVQDADRLDAIGAIGIARTMAYSGNKGRLIHDPNKQARDNLTLEDYRKGEDTAIMHFYEKLLKLKDLMNTETGKKLAEQRHQFMLDYLDQFYAEWEGER